MFKIQSNYESLVVSSQTSFLKKFQEIFQSEDISKEIKNFPLSTFIKLKIMSIKKIYPRLPKVDAIRMCIYSIEDEVTRKQFTYFLNSDLDDILNYSKSIDLFKNKN